MRELFSSAARRHRARAAFPHARYIRSDRVSVEAVIGRGVGIGEGVVINPGVEIGDFTYLNRGALVISGRIGSYCSIAHFVHIGAEQHPVNFLSTSPYVYGRESVFGADVPVDELPSPPTLGHDVWVGSAAIIQQGVTVGDGAIIAAGSVVTRDVEPFAIVAGVPARPLRPRFDADVVQMILGDPWWLWPISEAARLRALANAGEHWPRLYARGRPAS